MVNKYIRHPGSYSSETDNITKEERESDEDFEARKKASIVFKRYNDYQILFNKIHAMRYRFMAQIGKDKAKPFDDLRGIVNKIMLSARMLARLWVRDYYGTDEKQREKHWENIHRNETIFWDNFDDEDPINPKLNALITEIESTCQSIISGKGTLYGIINKKLGKNS
ncbi:hypothetical protein JYT87_03830 [Nitrospira defluvii]|nr:hypothetical protein [Nitrospira defluvii]